MNSAEEKENLLSTHRNGDGEPIRESPSTVTAGDGNGDDQPDYPVDAPEYSSKAGNGDSQPDLPAPRE
jgi:hypothetical protein